MNDDTSPDAREHGHTTPWQSLYLLLRPHSKDLKAIVIYAIGGGLLGIVIPLAGQTLVTSVSFGRLVQPIVVLSLALSVALIAAALFRLAQWWLSEHIQRKLFAQAVSRVTESLTAADVRAFAGIDGPELANRYFDVFLAQKAITSLLLDGVDAALAVVVGLLLVSFYHPFFLAFGLVLVLAVSLVAWLGLESGIRTAIKESKEKYRVAAHVEDMARHVSAMKLGTSRRTPERKLAELGGAWLYARDKHFRIEFRVQMAAAAIQVFATVALLGGGGWLVMQNELVLGQLVAAELVLTAIIFSLAKLFGKFGTICDLVASADKLQHLTHLVKEEHGIEQLSVTAATEVDVRDIVPVQEWGKPMSWRLQRGQSLALAGDAALTGSLVDCLVGFRRPQRGEVYLNGCGMNLHQWQEIRGSMVLLRSEEIWQGTIYDNLKRVETEPNLNEMWVALESVGLAATIRSLEKGLEQELISTGAPLASSHALRLTIARALLMKPSFVVVDRAFDGMEVEIVERLVRKFCQHAAVVVVSAREDVRQFCDQQARADVDGANDA